MGKENNKENWVVGEALEKVLDVDYYCSDYGADVNYRRAFKRCIFKDRNSNFYNCNSVASRVFAFSNENLSETMVPYNYRDKSVLTVGSSGDQALMALLLGAKDVTVADLNPFAHFYVELKKAAIMNLTLTEFKDFFSKRNIVEPKYYAKVSHDLDAESKLFWDNVILDLDNPFSFAMKFYQYTIHKCEKSIDVPYLWDSKQYYKLRRILNNKKISYKLKNITDFAKFDKKFDAILLSNIIDYMPYEQYVAVVNEMIDSILNENGFMQLAYVMASPDSHNNAENLFKSFPQSQINYDKFDLGWGNRFFKEGYNKAQLIYYNGVNPKKEKYINLPENDGKSEM